MKEKYKKREAVERFKLELLDKGFSSSIAETLSARGIGADNFDNYFSDKLTFHSPFDMPNMREAVEIISYVVECGGSILVYGDYDADGLTASSILALYFRDNGIDCDVIVPTRDEGYGLHADKVIEAFQEKYYDLVITVDCGISNAEDVSRIIEELGVEIIVTDHHELPDVMPGCICVNPKLGYPFANLAGAGVAWKVVEALAGREVASKYSELAAIGTIGDIMPMLDENRSIVKLGLENRNHKSLQKLVELSRCPSNLTSSDIAMKITPKINAAGRMGQPYAALEVLLCRDKADIAKVNKLMDLNEQRKVVLENIIAESEKMIDDLQVWQERMVFIISNHFPHGLLGIVASRYKEKYNVPSIVMTLDNDNYVGSARCVDGIDLYEVFYQCRDYLIKFGGHKASVGFSVAKEQLENFKAMLIKIFAQYQNEVFEKKIYYDIEISKECKVSDVVKLTDRLQPLLPQDRFVCRAKDIVKFANAFGKDNAHLSITLTSGLEIKGFNKGAYAPFIRNGASVDVLFSLEADSYTNNICGLLEDISLCNSVCFDEFYRLNLLKNFVVAKRNYVNNKNIADCLTQNSVLAIFDDYETFLKYSDEFDFSEFFIDVFFDNSVSRKTVVISPIDGYKFEKYQYVIAFVKKDMCRKLPSHATFFAVEPANESLYELYLDREICSKAFFALKHKGKFESLKSVYDKLLLDKITYPQYLVALRVFEELELIKIIDKYTVELNTDIKSDLQKSSIYNYFHTVK